MPLVDFRLLDTSQPEDPFAPFKAGMDLKTGMLQTELARAKIKNELAALNAISEGMRQTPTVTEEQTRTVDNPEYAEQKSLLQGLSKSDYVPQTKTITENVQRPETDAEQMARVGKAVMPYDLAKGITLTQLSSQMEKQRREAIAKSVQTYQNLHKTFGREAVLKNWDQLKKLDPFFQEIDPRTLNPDADTGEVHKYGPNKEYLGSFVMMTDPDGKPHVQFVQAKDMQAKELNAQADVDTFLLRNQARFGYDYTTIEGRKKGMQILGTPEVAKEFDQWRKENQPGYVVQTSEGIKLVGRGTGVAKDVKDEKGSDYKKPLPTEASKELSDLRTTHKRLGEVEAKVKNLGNKVGPLEGRWNKLKTRYISDGPTQEVINELESMITIAYGLSGKQISYQEMQLLKNAMLPRMEQPQENLLASIDFAKKWLASTHDERARGYESTGYGAGGVRLDKSNITRFDADNIASQLQYRLKRTPTEEELMNEFREKGVETIDGKALTGVQDDTKAAPSASSKIKVDPSKVRILR